jgi:hypothetical protein
MSDWTTLLDPHRRIALERMYRPETRSLKRLS